MNESDEVMWCPKAGKPFPMRLMSDRHIANAIAFLLRNGWRSVAESQADMPPESAGREVRIAWAAKHASPMLDRAALIRRTGRTGGAARYPVLA